MMMSALTPMSSSPRLTSTALVASATGKNEPKNSSLNAKLGFVPPPPQALTNDVFSPSVSLKVPADAPASSSAATSETAETKTATKPSTTTTTEVKPVGASPEKIEKAKTIMAETEVKFSTEKDPAKAKKLLNETYSQLKTLDLPKENLIVHAMQLDVWDAAIVNLLPANDKPVSAAVTTTTTTASSEKQTPVKDSGKEASDKSVNVLA